MMKQGIWSGFNSGGEVVSKNGKPFSLPADIQDCRDVVSVGDVLGYRDTELAWRVTHVDRYLVQTWGPMDGGVER